MTERIYDALRAILYLQFPKNANGFPVIYDRIVKNWYIGERQVVPDDISIIIHGGSTDESDMAFGYRKVGYSFDVNLYVAGDDQPTTLRIATEGLRIIRNILNQHKRMWVMDLCPICGKLPTSPEHFFSGSSHTDYFGNYGDEIGPTGPAGDIYNSFINTWKKTHPTLSVPGNLVKIQMTASGSGYTSAPSVVFAGGGFGHVDASATAVLSGDGVSRVDINDGGAYLTAIPTVGFAGGGGAGASGVAIINRPSPAGIAAAAYYDVLDGIRETGVFPEGLTNVQQTRFQDVIDAGVFTTRVLYDIQVSSTVPTNEFDGTALFSKGTASLKMSEVLPVEAFGPNFTDSGYDSKEAV